MAQNREQENKYHNLDGEKATSGTRGFHLRSKAYLKSKNSTLWIIEYSRRNCTLFFRLAGGKNNA
ncbi:MAG: hypothetical protein M3Q99_19055 [Acidobacteriota bacterium]|nr:hypothetical protein [Acidobacteriota bacterium]